MPKAELDKILFEAGGDLRIVEQKLSLNQGYLSDSDTMLVHIQQHDIPDIRIPSGNEIGAVNQWLPGGYTAGGVPEAVTDLSQSPFTERFNMNDKPYTKIGNTYYPKNQKLHSHDNGKTGANWRTWEDSGLYFFEFDTGHFASTFRKVKITKQEYISLASGNITDIQLAHKYMTNNDDNR